MLTLKECLLEVLLFVASIWGKGHGRSRISFHPTSCRMWSGGIFMIDVITRLYNLIFDDIDI